VHGDIKAAIGSHRNRYGLSREVTCAHDLDISAATSHHKRAIIEADPAIMSAASLDYLVGAH
jgi:hypothetical protein